MPHHRAEDKVATHFDHPLIAQRYFFPRAGRPARGEELVELADGTRLCCARHVVDEDAPTLVHFHGNGEIVADYIPGFAAAIGALGLNSFFAEYRGYGGSSGAPLMATMLDDAVATFDAAGVDPSRAFVFGRSVGSIYAIEVAHRRPGIAGLILESGIADPLERVLLRVEPSELGVTQAALQAEARQRFDHRVKLRAYTNPLLVLHARQDHLVHRSHAERNHTWAGSQDKELVLFDRGDHNSILAANRDAYFTALAAFFARA